MALNLSKLIRKAEVLIPAKRKSIRDLEDENNLRRTSSLECNIRILNNTGMQYIYFLKEVMSGMENNII